MKSISTRISTTLIIVLIVCICIAFTACTSDNSSSTATTATTLTLTPIETFANEALETPETPTSDSDNDPWNEVSSFDNNDELLSWYRRKIEDGYSLTKSEREIIDAEISYDSSVISDEGNSGYYVIPIKYEGQNRLVETQYNGWVVLDDCMLVGNLHDGLDEDTPDTAADERTILWRVNGNINFSNEQKKLSIIRYGVRFSEKIIHADYFCGMSGNCLIFKNQTTSEVYAVEISSDLKTISEDKIADHVKYVISSHYDDSSDYRGCPLFLMEDGSLKVYRWSSEYASDDKRNLYTPSYEGGYH